MRRAFEIALVGVSVGLAVVAVRTLTPAGSLSESIALGVAGLLLTVLHLALRQNMRQFVPIKPPAPTRKPRPTVNELFANEDDRSWTGLADPTLPSDKREQKG